MELSPSPSLPRAAVTLLDDVVSNLSVSPLGKGAGDDCCGGGVAQRPTDAALKQENKRLRKRVIVLTKALRTLSRVNVGRRAVEPQQQIAEQSKFDAFIGLLQRDGVMPTECSKCHDAIEISEEEGASRPPKRRTTVEEEDVPASACAGQLSKRKRAFGDPMTNTQTTDGQ